MNIPELATPAAIYALAELDEMQDFITEDLERFATAAIEAALPHIEAALRTQIANDIRGLLKTLSPHASPHDEGAWNGVADAARIAEEGTTK